MGDCALQFFYKILSENRVSVFLQISFVFKTFILPFYFKFSASDSLQMYLDLLSFGFVFFIACDFGIYNAGVNRLAQNGRFPAVAFLPLFVLPLFLLLFEVFDFSFGFHTFDLFLFFLYFSSFSVFNLISGVFRRNRIFGKFQLALLFSTLCEIALFISSDYFFGNLIFGIIFLSLLRFILFFCLIEFRSFFVFHDRKFFHHSLSLGAFNLGNNVNNYGFLLFLNIFSASSVVELFYFLRLGFRPVPVVLRVFSDHILRRYGAEDFRFVLGFVNSEFWSFRLLALVLVFINYIYVCFLNFGDFDVLLAVQLVSLEVVFLIFRTPHEILFINFENAFFSGFKSLIFYNAGLLFLPLGFFGVDPLLLVSLSGFSGSFGMFLYVTKLAKQVSHER